MTFRPPEAVDDAVIVAWAFAATADEPMFVVVAVGVAAFAMSTTDAVVELVRSVIVGDPAMVDVDDGLWIEQTTFVFVDSALLTNVSVRPPEENTPESI